MVLLLVGVDKETRHLCGQLAIGYLWSGVSSFHLLLVMVWSPSRGGRHHSESARPSSGTALTSVDVGMLKSSYRLTTCVWNYRTGLTQLFHGRCEGCVVVSVKAVWLSVSVKAVWLSV